MITWPSVHRRLLLGMAGLSTVTLPFATRARESRPLRRAKVETSTSKVWTEFFKGQRIWAYADRVSLNPGEPLNLMMSVGPAQANRRVRLEVFRLGAKGEDRIWTSDFADVKYQGATASAAAIGPGWPATFADIDTRSWPPGVYSCDVVEQTTATRDVRAAQWIVKNPKRSGAVLVRLGTNTWQAYNDWGGYDLYPDGDDDDTRGLIVSFDRPTPPAVYEYEAYLITWLEGLAGSLGGIDYASNFDIHADPKYLDPYPLVITGSHDEYWSRQEVDAFDRRIFKLGRNTAFFGANTAYCQIRYGDMNAPDGAAPQGRQIVCYKTAADPIVLRASPKDSGLVATSLFRAGARRPETMLTGGGFQSWFEPTTAQRPAYRVARNDLPFFAGTDWKVGDVAADVIGYEWDNRDPDGDGKRLWDPVRSHNAQLDEADISVLFHGDAVDVDGKLGRAEASYFRSKAGAQVFNAGTIRWAWGLGKPGFVNPAFLRFNENLVRVLAKRR